MSNLQLRYYKKPRNKFNKKMLSLLSLLKKKLFLTALALITIITLVIFVALPSFTTKVATDIRINDDKETFTQLVSATEPFYAEIEGKKIIANKIESSYYANLGKIEKTTQVSVGPYQNFLIFQKTLAPNSIITVNPKINKNNNFKLKITDEQSTNIFGYELEINNDDKDYTILENDAIMYQKGLTDNKCTPKANTKTIYSCKSMFGDSTKKVLDIKLRDKNNLLYEVVTNKVITLNGSVKINCTFPQEPKAGNNTVNCIAPVNSDIFVGDTAYKLIAGKETILNIDGKIGKNQFLMIGTDTNNQKIEQVIPFEVNSSFFFELSAAKNQFDINNPNNLEFILNTNEKLTVDIFANAKESTKGYSAFNSLPIDTNFGQLNYVNKDVKIDPSNNSFVLELDTTSTNNAAKKLVYAPIINVDFVIKSQNGKNLTANCKMYFKVNDKILDKSVCTIKNIN